MVVLANRMRVQRGGGDGEFGLAANEPYRGVTSRPPLIIGGGLLVVRCGKRKVRMREGTV